MLGRGKHWYELVLPRGDCRHVNLGVGGTIRISNDGDPEPFCIIEFLAKGRTRITFRDDDERFTAHDLELLFEHLDLEPSKPLGDLTRR